MKLEELLVGSYKLYDILIVMERPVNENLGAGRKFRIDKINSVKIDAWGGAFIRSFNIEKSWENEVYARVKQLSSKEELTFLATYGHDRVLGVSALFSCEKISGLYCLGTIPSERGRGVASSLVQKCVEEARKQGSEVLCLQTLQKDNLEGFYRRLGFRRTLTKRIYVKK